MNPARGTVVAIALLLAACAATGCGLGPGADLGEVSLTVTRDYGAESLPVPGRDSVSESDTVMRVLERNAEIGTRYGGAFVQSIDGLEEEERFGRAFDWLFYVNGVESPVGAADYPLHGGEAIWWDYRDWSAALRVPAVVGSWPQPFLAGYEGRRHPVAVVCLGGGAACGVVRDMLADARVEPVSVSTGGGDPGGASADSAIRVLVGPWARVRVDPAAAQIEDGPQASGIFARFERHAGGWELVGLGVDGEAARTFGRTAGLVAATRRFDAPPTWLVTGVDRAGVAAAADLLDAADLRDRYALATEGGRDTPLPAGPSTAPPRTPEP